jgi:hypothetical protein
MLRDGICEVLRVDKSRDIENIFMIVEGWLERRRGLLMAMRIYLWSGKNVQN